MDHSCAQSQTGLGLASRLRVRVRWPEAYLLEKTKKVDKPFPTSLDLLVTGSAALQITK